MDNVKIDADGYLQAFTDGSCKNNGQPGAKAGKGGYFGPNHPWNFSEPVRGRATNNTAEIEAATDAINRAKSAGYDKIKITSDSDFLRKSAQEWMPNWKANNWTKADGKPVVNTQDFMDLDRASRGISVKYDHVRGHTGNRGNEAADRLARQGADRY